MNFAIFLRLPFPYRAPPVTASVCGQTDLKIIFTALTYYVFTDPWALKVWLPFAKGIFNKAVINKNRYFIKYIQSTASAQELNTGSLHSFQERI